MPRTPFPLREEKRPHHKPSPIIFWDLYSIRSGIEGTIDQAVEKLGMIRSLTRGITKTHFQHLVTAAIINIQRMQNWLAEVSRFVTYQSHFEAQAVA